MEEEKNGKEEREERMKMREEFNVGGKWTDYREKREARE